MPGRFGEESEAVLALISGSLDQPAGEAGAGSAPRAGRRRSPGAVGAPWPAPGMPGAPGMLARRLASNNVDSFPLMTDIFCLSGTKILLS